MSWEDRFSTMVKESSAKIDEAKRRLHSFDNSRILTVKNNNLSSVLSPPAFQSTPNTGVNQAASLRTMRTNGLDDSPFTSHGTSSTALLHNLYEKIERQSQGFDLLKSKVETLESELNNQRREMQQFKERLSQLVQRVESFKPEKDHGTTFEEFKSEIRCELNKIKDSILDPKDENDDYGWKTTTTERLGHHMTESGQVLSSLEEINSRLDKIESDLSSSQHNVENNSKMVEKNVSLLSDWRNENMESMNRLCKLQDLSVDEVKHLRSKLYDVRDKIHELETSLNDACVHNKLSTSRRSNSFLDDDMNPKVKHSYISISSDEDERHSLTNSSVNLDASDHGDSSLETDELNLDSSDRQRKKSQSSGSDLLHSSLNSLTGSSDSLSEI